MTYLFESLGDERFQQLCQALLTDAHEDVQCLPVGQPDGGRDAFVDHHDNKPGTISHKTIFQVKYVKDPSSRESRDLIEQVVRGEKHKVINLVGRGATSYYLITNVAGTSHLDTGSIDKVNKELQDGLGIPAYCWWRDDLSRRIDNSNAIKWSYPEILRGTDVLAALLDRQSDPTQQGRIETIRSYMAFQYGYDAKLKFKQIDLEKNIIDLIVDVPARFILPKEASRKAYWINKKDSKIITSLSTDSPSFKYDDPVSEHELSRAPGTVQLLASTEIAHACTRVVIEGAPG